MHLHFVTQEISFLDKSLKFTEVQHEISFIYLSHYLIRDGVYNGDLLGVLETSEHLRLRRDHYLHDRKLGGILVMSSCGIRKQSFQVSVRQKEQV